MAVKRRFVQFAYRHARHDFRLVSYKRPDPPSLQNTSIPAYCPGLGTLRTKIQDNSRDIVYFKNFEGAGTGMCIQPRWMFEK